MLPGHLVVDGTNTKPSKSSTPAGSGEASYFALLVPLILLGVALFVSDRYFTYIDDECYIIDMAARPAFHTVRLLAGGWAIGAPAALRSHPPCLAARHAWMGPLAASALRSLLYPGTVGAGTTRTQAGKCKSCTVPCLVRCSLARRIPLRTLRGMVFLCLPGSGSGYEKLCGLA